MVLASMQPEVILGQILREEAGGWFPSLHLLPPEDLSISSVTMLVVCNPYILLYRYYSQ